MLTVITYGFLIVLDLVKNIELVMITVAMACHGKDQTTLALMYQILVGIPK
ncbi:hypothetical protein N9C98_00075 [Synechococcus sp. AH-224-G16]|nr:hypothetical protein [Synechococcus sp. AH-224-G16]